MSSKTVGGAVRAPRVHPCKQNRTCPVGVQEKYVHSFLASFLPPAQQHNREYNRLTLTRSLTVTPNP